MDAARKKGRRLPYPVLDPEVDYFIWDENCTRHLYSKWNHSIVTKSLGCVKEFRPCYWLPTSRNVGPKAPRGIPDAGGYVLLPSADANAAEHSAPHRSVRAQLHIEFKPASKWTSATMSQGGDYVNDDGTWKGSSNRSNAIMPIRQAYTYCVASKCRYGCILTGEEAVIFRIKPLKAPDTDG